MMTYMKEAKPAKILLLDLGGNDGLPSEIAAILDSSRERHLQLKFATGDEFTITGKDLRQEVSAFQPDLVIAVLTAGALKSFGFFCESIKKELPVRPIVAVVAEGGVDGVVDLLQAGATDFVAAPLRPVDLLPRIWRLLEHRHPDKQLMQSLKEKMGLKQLIGESASFTAVIDKIPAVAQCDVGVLITGETGTGKGMVAQAIHYLSPRAGKPFVPVNCGAIPTDLFENELFGHNRGAFTGASSAHRGLIQEANEGTLFLDEIDCIPLQAQVKLLRFLQDKEYRPLGCTTTRRSDVRVIAATNSNLDMAIKNGQLRQDLYFRLSVIPLMLPPLRERRGDIQILARHFLDKYSWEFVKQRVDVSPAALQALISYDWPGNVRELEHVVQRAVILNTSGALEIAELGIAALSGNADASRGFESFRQAKSKVIAEFEKNYIQILLSKYNGNISKSAQAAQKNRRAFFQLVRKHRVDVQRFR